MSRGPEGKIQDAVLKYARSKGILYKKNEVGRFFVSSGWPDVTIYPGAGRAYFMEFKAPGGKLTPLQDHVRKDLERAGYGYWVVDNAAEGRGILERFGE